MSVVSMSSGPLVDVKFTLAPNVTGVARARQCWSEIMTWRHESAAWHNANVANRTWTMGLVSTEFHGLVYHSTTLYPAHVSTYRLCDGTPRANVSPITKHWSVTTYSWDTYNEPLTPSYHHSQPCTPDPEMCVIWYYDSNIQIVDDLELLRQCGLPAHEQNGAPCIVGGGPVRLVFFPVPSVPGDLCGHNISSSTTAPTVAGSPVVVTTRGHTFTSGSVYLSFKTLYASYDGFPDDRFGPTFSNYILPLPSSAISTQCGGFYNRDAWGTGTPLNYADLNWPIPASAYSCQARCYTPITAACAADCTVCPATCNAETPTTPPECSTIWSDVNLAIAVPTKVRHLAPEWSTCSFWDAYIPNFWFDPPIALQQQPVMATPTLDPTVVTTPAAPSSTARSPLPKATSTPHGQDPGHPTTAVGDRATHGGSSSNTVQVAPQSRESLDVTKDPTRASALSPAVVSTHAEHSTNAKTTTPLALSVLSQALSPTETEDSLRASTQSSEARAEVHSAQSPGPQSNGDPNHGSPEPTAILTSGSHSYTPFKASGHVVLASKTLKVGQATTVSGVQVSAVKSGMVVGSSTIPFTGMSLKLIRTLTSEDRLPFSAVDATQGLPTHPPGVAVLSAGSLTLTASSVSGASAHAIAVLGTTLSLGGPAETVQGQAVSQGSSGLVLIGPKSTTSTPVRDPRPSVGDDPTRGNEASTFVAGSFTVTVAVASGTHAAISVDGTTLSEGRSVLETNGIAVIIDSHGLELEGHRTTEKFTALSKSHTPRPPLAHTTPEGKMSTQSMYATVESTHSSPASRLRAVRVWQLLLAICYVMGFM